MPTADNIRWLKQNFLTDINAAIKGTVYPADLVVAVACQETGYIWGRLRKNPKLNVAEVVALCNGDTIDGTSKSPRRAFPVLKKDLLKAANGQAMFDIARDSMIQLSKYLRDFDDTIKNPDKFFHGFGIFQYDLQHFKTNPAYFLQKKYTRFADSLGLCVSELEAARKRIGYGSKTRLTDMELCAVAIAYNKGSYDPRKGLKQGYKSDGRYYGENIYSYLLLSRTVSVSAAPPVIAPPSTNEAVLPAPTPVEGKGKRYEVDTKTTTLRVRSTPLIPAQNKLANVIAELPEGTIVQAVTDRPKNKFLEIVTNLGGAFIHGYCHTSFLRSVAASTPIQPTAVMAAAPTAGIVEAHLPTPSGLRVTRTARAGAHSLNESGRPSRLGSTPAELAQSIHGIIGWLDVTNNKHLRYKPGDGLTFCNIYAHDFCALSGVYLPRVWWTEPALLDLANGKPVQPRYGSTVFEARANDLFRWLRDHGPRFGWRQTGSLTKLQQAANEGGIGVIVARRRIEGRSGHIVMVAPESEHREARRDNTGEVVMAVESQAGSVNFSYGAGTLNWWRGDRFAEFAFHIHS